LKQKSVASVLVLGWAVCSAACGLSGDGTATSRGIEGGADGTTGEGGSGGGRGGNDAAGDDSAGDDGTVADGMIGDEAAVDGALLPDSTLGGGDSSSAEDSGDAPSSSPEGGPVDAAGTGDAGIGSADGAADSGAPVDAGADQQQEAAAPDAGGDDAAVDGGACDFTGTWASRLTIDVTWAPQGLNGIILASGSGQIQQWTKGERVQTGMSTSDATVVCGIDLPDFQETAIAGGETYGVRFPDSLFDNGYLPTFTVSGIVSGFTAGSAYSTTTTAALLGLSMANPTTDPWPATITTEVDMDQDGKPGVTIDVAQGSPYSDIPTEIPGLFQTPARANKLYVAIRQVTIINATVQDCDHMTGTVSIPEISSKYAIDSHVLGCALDGDGGDCTTTVPLATETSQAAFVDNTQPVFTPSGTTDVQSVRLATGATCADVRAALP
jgi:hypothetical protein